MLRFVIAIIFFSLFTDERFFFFFFPNTQFRSSENKLLENINILKGQTLLSMLDKEISVNRKLIFKPGNEQGLIFCFHFKFRIFKNVYKIY